MNISRSALFFVVGTLALVPVASANDTDNLNVTATVDDTCSIAVNVHVAFGNYDILAPDDATAIGELAVQCTPGATHAVELGAGNNHNGSTRRMTNGTDFLEYDLYQDGAHTILWATGADGWDYTEQGTGEVLGVQGLLPKNQAVPTGNYSDTVVATIVF
jgi:spore coat protein U-like protein